MISGREKKIESPCTKVCKIGDYGLCQGCYRTIDEITAWPFSTDEQKKEILLKIKNRKERWGFNSSQQV